MILTSVLLNSIIVLTPMPAHFEESATPITWRFVGLPGPAARHAIKVGMFPLFLDPSDGFVTVHLAGRGQTVLELYPNTAAVLSLVTDNEGKILGADIAVNWRLRKKEMSEVVSRVVKILRTEGVIHMSFRRP